MTESPSKEEPTTETAGAVERRDRSLAASDQSASGDSVWQYVETDDGQVYYVNTVTMETRWDLPAGE